MLRLGVLAAVVCALTCALTATGQQRRDPQRYCRLHRDHQLCNRRPPSPAMCGRVIWQGATPPLRQLVLDMHNVVRSQTARGKVKGYDDFLPQAANMMQLVSRCAVRSVV